MIRIREIDDPDLKEKVIRAVAEWRGLSPSTVPGWFELDDADFVDILNAIREDQFPLNPSASDYERIQ